MSKALQIITGTQDSKSDLIAVEACVLSRFARDVRVWSQVRNFLQNREASRNSHRPDGVSGSIYDVNWRPL